MRPLHVVFAASLVFGSAIALSAQTASSPTPLQVAEDLDGIVQPRFRQNAGRFGVDRVLVAGHDGIYDLNIHNARERALLRQAKDAHRPFIIGFLHSAHKPGHSVGAHDREIAGAGFQPYAEILATATISKASTDRLYTWGELHLKTVAVSHFALLQKGQNVDADSGNWMVAMRPVRASQASCLGCHTGAKPGETLGVMLYAVDKNVMPSPLTSMRVGLQ